MKCLVERRFHLAGGIDLAIIKRMFTRCVDGRATTGRELVVYQRLRSYAP